MPKNIRIIVSIDNVKKNFISICETKKGDLIVTPRGKHHSIDIQPGDLSQMDFSITSNSVVEHESFTIHSNPNSKIASITINRHQRLNTDAPTTAVSYLLNVKHGLRIAPIYVSVGRNLKTPRLNFMQTERPLTKDDIELWPNSNINSDVDSVAYLLGVANPNVRFVIPEEFPRNFEVRYTRNFQIVFLYWEFNFPMRKWGTSWNCGGSHDIGPVPRPGLGLHEVLNLTNNVTMEHLTRYESYIRLLEK